MSFGYDEESAGRGADELAAYLTEHNSPQFAMIVDEGGSYNRSLGTVFANPMIAEKGYMDVKIVVKTLGGHSSIPPQHTSIGYLSILLAELEAHPRAANLTRESLVFRSIECSAVHGTNIPKDFRNEVLKASAGNYRALKNVETMVFSGEARVDVGEEDVQAIRALLSTTQAVDVISGGVKVNALPEEAYAIVNHRIATESSVTELEDSIISTLLPVAEKYELALVDFGNKTRTSGNGKSGLITIANAWDTAPLYPSPISPTDSEAYRILSGTIRGAWKSDNPDANDIVVAPSLAGGNTDTKAYWSLSPNIYRYNHIGEWHSMNGVHTTNEALRVDGFVSNIKFLVYLILNADESDKL